ncbi:MAG: Rrf2 family transcriptional regulator [Myxococcota bacterium]
MKLSTRAEYGTRALIELASQFEHNKPLMLQTIAENQGLSKKYLEQLFALLKKSRLVKGIRGPSGGYQLTRPPEEITLSQIVESLEGSLAVAECLTDPELCVKNGQCATQEIWGKITAAIEQTLGAITLAELNERHTCLTQQLHEIPSLSTSVAHCIKPKS